MIVTVVLLWQKSSNDSNYSPYTCMFYRKKYHSQITNTLEKESAQGAFMIWTRGSDSIVNTEHCEIRFVCLKFHTCNKIT